MDAANSENEVVAIVREYVATLSEGDVARLPDPCKPPVIDSAATISEFAFALVRHHCIVDGATARLVTKLSALLTYAERRLRKLSAS